MIAGLGRPLRIEVPGGRYNLRDRILASTNSNGVISTNQYDAVGRVLIRGYPDGGKEQWSHALGFAEPARYTNQIGNITTWAYDAAQRRTNEIAINSSGAPVYTNTFNYAPAGDLRELFDGKSQKTAWGYNSEGQITSKTNQAGVKTLTYAYDANGRATSRWTAAKGTTSYTYDGLGNRTLVNYPSSADITLQYSALSRLTNIVDASGTTQFAYNTAGDVLTEDGPFAVNVKNELTSAPTGSCAYDANGNITSDGGRSFSYDDENQLTSVIYGTTYRHDFVYDGLGRLRKRIDYSWTGSSLSS